ncbi:MAG: Rieske (2Fe-2S) protein [Burkholderiales bacterium]
MREICDSAALVDRGKGIRFMVERQGETLPAFAIRYGGRVYAYLNQCPHLGSQLDWIEGEFFDSAALLLICATHGATFAPDSGYCVSGPCKGQALERLSTRGSRKNLLNRAMQ